MKTRFLLLPMIVLLMFSVGCRKGADTVTLGGNAATAKSDFTSKDMREAIFQGCADKNWRAVDLDANTIEATIVVRGKHTVVVAIPYTASSFAINYKSSINMNARDGKIHPNYNNWVNYLDQAIRRRIALQQ